MSDIQSVAALYTDQASDDRVADTVTITPSSTLPITIPLSKPIFIKGGTTVRMGVTYSSNYLSPANCTGNTCVKSGDSFTAKIASNYTGAPWNSSYIGKANIHAVDAKGKQVVVAVKQTSPSVVLRKGYPGISLVPQSNSNINNSDLELFKFTVNPLSSSSDSRLLAMKSFTLNITTTPGVTVIAPQLRNGSNPVPLANYDVLFNGVLSTGKSFTGNGSALRVTFLFHREEVISSTPATYSVHSFINGSTPGAEISTSFYQSGAMMSINHCLSADADPLLSGSSRASTNGIIWSDNTALPHSDAACSASGSSDFYNDALIGLTTQAQTLR